MLRITDFLTIPPKRGPLWTPVARKLWGSEAVRRATNATLIVAMLVSPSIPTALVRGPALTDEQVAEAIAAVAEAPFDSTPLRLRRSAAEILLPISVPHPQPKEQEHVLPRAMVDRLVADNTELFVDEGRIQDSSVLSHDWELVKRLVRLIRDRATSQEAQIRSLDGLTLLLRADRYMTGLAVRDARTVLEAAIDGDGLSANDLKKARAHMNTAELRLRNGIDALERGDGDGAVEHFLKAYEFAAAVLAVWHIDYRGDLDGDEVVDLVEMRIGSSVFLEDTDGDGLSDAYEVENTIPHTMPDAADTDEDDLPDGEEDLDEDLLTNAMERDLGTDPLEPDTDDDGLPDSAEAAQPGLDPLEADTDGDGLTDESELRLGTDPGNEDSDGDDIEDGDETHLQIVELPGLDVVVEVEGVGDHSRSLRGQSLADAPLFSEVPGLVAPFVALGDTLLFERAAIRMSYDPGRVPGGDTDNLRLLLYDFEEGVAVILPDQEVDTELQAVAAEAAELGAFGVVYLPEWEATFASDAAFVAAPAGSSIVLARWAPRSEARPAAQAESSPTAMVTETAEATSILEANPTATPQNSPTGEVDSSPTPTETSAAEATATATAEPTPTLEPTPEEADIPLPVPMVEGQRFTAVQSLGPSFQQAEASEGEFVIAGGPALQRDVAVAYNALDRKYLTVWVVESEPASLRGRLYDENGGQLGAEILLSQGGVGVPIRPDISANENDGGYLVIWSEANGGQSVESYCLPGGCLTYTLDTYNLYALAIGPDGSLSGAPNLITDQLTFFGFIEIVPAYDAAYNSFSGQYLLAWNQPRGGFISFFAQPHRLLGQLLDPSGAPLAAPTVLVDRMVSSVTVTYNRARNEFLTTYNIWGDAVLQYELLGQRRHGSGLGLLGAINFSGNSAGWQIAPAAVHDPADDRYLVTWWDNRDSPDGVGDQRGRVVSGTLVPVGPLQTVLEPPDPAQGVFQWEPRAGFSPVEGRFLVIAGFGVGPDLHGRYVLPDSSPDGEAFPIAHAAIQGGIAARAEDGEELPHWFVAWNQEGDVLGRTYPAAGGTGDSDFDGLTDAQELAGFMTAFGFRLFTDPFKADTDGDGIPDGEELGALVTFAGRTFYTLLSHPSRPDSDNDDVEDFVELREVEPVLHVWLPDSDADRVSDGDELYEFGTDPLGEDSDGDGASDGDEIRDGRDPLLAVSPMGALEITHQFVRGAVLGEFAVDEPESGNIPFFAGYMGSGLISLAPFPLTTAIGLIADLRDWVGAMANGDWASFGVNTLALVPYIGDAADVSGTVGRFVVRHFRIIGEVSTFLSRLDWLPDAVRLAALQATWGRPLMDTLAELGFEGPRVLRLGKASVHLQGLADALRRLRADFPGIADYLSTIEVSEKTGILRGNLLTADLKHLGLSQALGNLKGVEGVLNNIKGAYTQFVVRGDRLAEGWRVIDEVPHVNAAGYDLVVERSGIVRLLEAKARARLPLTSLSQYVRRVGDELKFNTDYLIGELGPTVAEPLLRSGRIEIEFYLNGPESARMAQGLLDAMGSNLAKYDFDGITHEIEVIVRAVNR